MESPRTQLTLPMEPQWVNTDAALQVEALRGRLVLFHFFSYDCVHCQLACRSMRELQGRYEDGLVVVGVHTPRYPAQRDAEAVCKAAHRLHLRYPVLNDPDWRLWREYGISAWPTAVLFDYMGRRVDTYAGEGWQSEIDQRIERLLHEAVMQDRRMYEIAPRASYNEADTPLRFPTHVLATEKRLLIADAGHNRVLEATHEGNIVHQWGSGSPGLWDGPYDEAGFDTPQDIAVLDQRAYVADAGNHAVRSIDLVDGQVRTELGNGKMGRERPRRHPGAQTLGLSSPAAVALHGDRMYVAVTGQHQVWELDMGHGRVDVLAGSGRNGDADGRGEECDLSQPAALAYVDGGLLVAESGGNRLRMIDLKSRQVSTLVGGSRFDFGREDASMRQARFAHPLGMTLQAGGRVFVSDSLNHRIVVLDTLRAPLREMPGDWEWNEPCGLSIAAGALWVANCNRHEIVRVDLGDGHCRHVPVGE